MLPAVLMPLDFSPEFSEPASWWQQMSTEKRAKLPNLARRIAGRD